jgi:hypothetical protein
VAVDGQPYLLLEAKQELKPITSVINRIKDTNLFFIMVKLFLLKRFTLPDIANIL